jgi:hypothetical protein
MIDCKKCQEVNHVVTVQTPSDLTKAIQVIRDNLADGTLRQSDYWPHDQIRCDPSFSELPEHAPWPDYVRYFFQCPECLRTFELSVETYHGAGGQWRPVA